MKVELRSRSFGELLSLNFSLYFAHLPKLILIASLFQLPLLALQLLVLLQADAFAQLPADASMAEIQAQMNSRLVPLLAVLGAGFFSLLLLPVQQAASVILVAGSFSDHSPSLGECLGVAFRRIGGLLMLVLVTGVLYAIGALMLFLPFLFFYAIYYVSAPAFIVEGLSFSDAMGRSTRLSKGSRWPILGFGLLLVTIGYAALALPNYVIGQSFARGSTFGIVAAWVLGVVVSGLSIIGPVVWYFQLRVDKEAYDLDAIGSLVDRIGEGVGAAPTAR